MKKESHTGFRNGKLFCFNCGTFQDFVTMPVFMATDFLKSFEKHHKNCQKTWIEPVNETNGKTEYENENWWMIHGEQGISSKTMFNHLSDRNRVQISYNECHPLDPDDFRRCYLLLKAVPQFKAKLDRLKPLSEVWANLIENWDRLTEMLEEQMATKKENGMYEFMKTLIY